MEGRLVMLKRQVVRLPADKGRWRSEKGTNTTPPGEQPASSPGKSAAEQVHLTQKLALYLSISFFFGASCGFGQMMLKPLQPSEPITLLPGDAAVFESPEFRKDLPCRVTGRKAELGFDLRFHSG